MKSFFRKKTKPVQARALNLPAAPMAPPPFLGGSALTSRTRQLAAYQGWVYAAVSAIAGRVAGVPLRLSAVSNGDKAEVAGHPLLTLMSRPNPIMSGRQFRFTVMSQMDLTGMAFVLVAADRLGRPGQLWPLNPADLIEITSGGTTGQAITGFVFQSPGGQRQTYSPGEILYFRHPSPSNLIYGSSPIEAMAHAYDIDTAVRVYQRNFFRNSARPEVVLSTDQRLTEQEAKRILTRWNQKHQGLAHVFEPTVLDAGLNVKPLNFSAKDFEFMALAGWTRDNILAAYGVPAGKLGLVNDVNRANSQGIDITFNAECIKPRLDLIEDVLNAFLAPRFGSGLVLAHDNPVPTDREQGHKEAMDMLDRGVITINELRTRQGKAPLPWGDEPYAPQTAQLQTKTDEQALWLGWAAEKIKAAWPRLEARFNGWSGTRVRAELEMRPELLDDLCPPGGAEQKAGLKAMVADGLAMGETLEQILKSMA